MTELPLTLKELTLKTKEKYISYYGCAPQWIVAAPGRVNIIGEHTDYNGGFVFPMGIERYTILAGAPCSESDKIKVRCMRFNESVLININKLNRSEPIWSNYIRGVIAGYQERGVKIPSMNVIMNSNVPLGGGLSSSAALEVATGTLIEAAAGIEFSLQDRALIGQKAEHDYAGVPCGIMDQFISAMARKDQIMLLDCRSYETRWTSIKDPDVSFLIINSNVKHQLASGEYGKRRAECENAAKIMGIDLLRDATLQQLENAKVQMGNTSYKRAKHVITENERTLKAAEALEKSQFEVAGQYMYQSHESLSKDFEVSCEELDQIVLIAHKIGLSGGIYGCRMTGGGFGGCAIALVKTTQIQQITQTIEVAYKKATGLTCSIFSSRPAMGAHKIQI